MALKNYAVKKNQECKKPIWKKYLIYDAQGMLLKKIQYRISAFAGMKIRNPGWKKFTP